MILVIDDEACIRDTVSDILSMAGYEVSTAEDGLHGLQVYHQHAEDIGLVMLDLSMPGLDGAETFGRLRQLNPHLPVIISSGYYESGFQLAADPGNHTQFLPKPYTMGTLLQRVNSFLHS